MSFGPNYAPTVRFSRDDYKGLSGSINDMGNILDRNTKTKLAAEKATEEQRRFELKNARAEETAQQRRDALAEEKAKTDFLKGYDPNVGTHSNDVMQGLRGIDRSQQVGMADKAGAEIQTILKNYGVEGGTTIGDISADRQKALGLELGGKAKTSTAELAPTQEAVRNLVERDIIQNTGGAKAADSLATLYSGKYDSRENILKQEQNLTEARNDEIERRKKDLTRTLKLNNTLSKGATRTKAPKVNTFEEIESYIGDSGVGSFDANEALAMSKDAEDQGISLSRIKQGLSKLKTPSKFGLPGLFQDKDFKFENSGEFLKFLAENTSDVAKDGTRGLTAIEKQILNAEPQVSLSMDELMRGRGITAAERGFGDTVPSRTPVLEKQPSPKLTDNLSPVPVVPKPQMKQKDTMDKNLDQYISNQNAMESADAVLRAQEQSQLEESLAPYNTMSAPKSTAYYDAGPGPARDWIKKQYGKFASTPAGKEAEKAASVLNMDVLDYYMKYLVPLGKSFIPSFEMPYSRNLLTPEEKR